MSTDSGIGSVVNSAVAQAKALVDQATVAEEQMSLLEPLDAEELLEAREALGPAASHLSVVKEARAARGRGRPAGVRNRRTDDLVAYLSQFGPDPAVAAMRIIGTAEELMIERSIKAGDGKRRMTFAEAQAHRMRMIEAMLPYWHGKKPVAVDLSFSGVGDLIIEGVTHSRAELNDIMEADFLPLDDDGGEGEA